MRERANAIADSLDAEATTIDRRRPGRGGALPPVARRRPLHVPRLPRVRGGAGAGRTDAAAGRRIGSGHPAEHRREGGGARALDAADRRASEEDLEPGLLNLTKANSRATVQRGSYLDYVGIKRFDAQGRPVGERRFLGLYPRNVAKQSLFDIPIVRRKMRGRAGPRGRPAARLRGAGARRHPGQLPAGRAAAVRGRRPVQRRHRDPRAAAPAAAPAAGPPRRLRAVLLLLRRPAARQAHRGGPRAHPRDPDGRVPRRARRGVDARHRLVRRPAALRDLHPARRRARPRHAR